MDGLLHGKPYEQMDDLGGTSTIIFGFNTHIDLGKVSTTLMDISYRKLHTTKTQYHHGPKRCQYDPKGWLMGTP